MPVIEAYLTISFLFSDLICFMAENILQTLSAFLMRNISVWEIYLC